MLHGINNYGLTVDGRVAWPDNPGEGDTFFYVDPIGGASFVYWEFRNGVWHYLETI
jgi:hypothetical protein